MSRGKAWVDKQDMQLERQYEELKERRGENLYESKSRRGIKVESEGKWRRKKMKKERKRKPYWFRKTRTLCEAEGEQAQLKRKCQQSTIP